MCTVHLIPGGYSAILADVGEMHIGVKVPRRIASLGAGAGALLGHLHQTTTIRDLVSMDKMKETR